MSDEVAAHVIAADAARAEGFTGLAEAHTQLARELCACGQMFETYCPGPGDGRCPLGE